MDAKLQRRVQRYGWDLAASAYEALWSDALAPAQQALLTLAQPRAGEHVVDVACGTGRVALAAAQAVGPTGRVIGVDLSQRMIDAARAASLEAGLGDRCDFARMDAEQLDLPPASQDLVCCAFGLMYCPQPAAALCEMRRILRTGGRLALAIWGERERCGWSGVFPIVDAEVASDVCPLFFQLGQPGMLARACGEAGFRVIAERRLAATLAWRDEREACRAALVGGPVALAWSRFDAPAQSRVERAYLDSIAPWRGSAGYRIPAEFVLVVADVSNPTA